MKILTGHSAKSYQALIFEGSPGRTQSRSRKRPSSKPQSSSNWLRAMEETYEPGEDFQPASRPRCGFNYSRILHLACI